MAIEQIEPLSTNENFKSKDDELISSSYTMHYII
jgi:hypothetical protein